MPLKCFIVSLFVAVLSFQVKAQQQTADIGLFGGGAIPFSDYSKIKLGESVHLNYGGFYRYNFNSRYSLRINALYGTVGAAGEVGGQTYPGFQKNVFDMGAFFEINYLDFLLGVEQMNFSPYVFYGLGVSFYQGTAGNAVVTMNLPFGTGVKYAIGKRWSVGAEVSTRKLTNDELDNLNTLYQDVNLEQVTDFWHNNDWVTYFGLTLTYKFYWGKTPCPAYGRIND